MLIRNTTLWNGGGTAPHPAFVQAGSVFTSTSTLESYTFGYTCTVSPGSNRILGLLFSARVTSGLPLAALTYNGQAMAIIEIAEQTAGGPDTVAGMALLLETNVPNDGSSHNFAIDWAGSTTSNSFKAQAFELINVAQSTPTRFATAIPTSATVASVDVTSVPVGALMMLVSADAVTSSSTPGSDQVEIGDDSSTAHTFAASYKLPEDHAGGTVNMTHTYANSGNIAAVAAAFEKAA